jgi:P-type Ca2+ transporter type 2C
MKFELSDVYSISAEQSFELLGTKNAGLSSEEAESRQKTYGLNEISGKKKKGVFVKILELMIDPMVIILFIASGFSFFIKDYIEGIAIFGVVIINTIISLIQDRKAEKAVEELKKILSPHFNVLRDGNQEIIGTKFIVPGDIIVFESGDIIPADARIIDAKELLVDEAHLTGESEPISKNTTPINKGGLKLYEMQNILFTGSKILNGHGKALIVKTGSSSEMGAIAKNITDAEEEITPLQKKLKKETAFLVGLSILSAIFVLLVSILRAFQINEAILIAICVMVAVFPEGLPATITIALALAIEKLAKNSVIVKKLSSVETLGNVDFICTDKTGTITQHKMSVKELLVGDKFYSSASVFALIAEGKVETLHDIFLTSVKCSTAKVVEEDGNIVKEMGDPTEIALIRASFMTGYKESQFDSYKIIDTVPFSSDRMFSAILTENANGKKEIFIKGAPDKIIAFCGMIKQNEIIKTLDAAHKEHIAKELAARAQKGFRLIGFVKKDADKNAVKIDLNDLKDFVFLGAGAIYDPPKDEVKSVIKTAKEANIKVVMITGDSKNTGYSIAESVGISENISEAVEGRELEALPDEVFSRNVENYRVYSRVSPSDKLKQA